MSTNSLPPLQRISNFPSRNFVSFWSLGFPLAFVAFVFLLPLPMPRPRNNAAALDMLHPHTTQYIPDHRSRSPRRAPRAVTPPRRTVNLCPYIPPSGLPGADDQPLPGTRPPPDPAMILRDWIRSLDCISNWSRAETNDLVEILMDAGLSTKESIAASTWPACKAQIRAKSLLATDSSLLAVRWVWLEATTNPPSPRSKDPDSGALARAIEQLSKVTEASQQGPS